MHREGLSFFYSICLKVCDNGAGKLKLSADSISVHPISGVPAGKLLGTFKSHLHLYL
jgi:hypothetical protein